MASVSHSVSEVSPSCLLHGILCSPEDISPFISFVFHFPETSKWGGGEGKYIEINYYVRVLMLRKFKLTLAEFCCTLLFYFLSC